MLGKLFCLVRLAEQRGDLRQNPGVVLIKCRGRERDRRELRDAGKFWADVIPVAQPKVRDVIGRVAAEIRDVAFHAVVMLAQQIEVAVKFILLPRHENVGAAPLG